jgi:hypothetical protein
MLLLGGVLIGALALPITTQAQDAIDRREAEQRQRIRQGINEGSLTRTEAQRLRMEQRRIRDLERQFWTDGRLDRQERRVLQRELNRASHNIEYARRNRYYR